MFIETLNFTNNIRYKIESGTYEGDKWVALIFYEDYTFTNPYDKKSQTLDSIVTNDLYDAYGFQFCYRDNIFREYELEKGLACLLLPILAEIMNNKVI